MRDTTLIEDIAAVRYANDPFDVILNSGITTYSALFATIRDEYAPLPLREAGCLALGRLSKTVDKRRAVPVLLTALESTTTELHFSAIFALTLLNSKRGVPKLRAIAADKHIAQSLRRNAIYALGTALVPDTINTLLDIINDENEAIELRAEALEQSQNYPDESLISLYIEFLSHPSADLRFWAAYCLVCIPIIDISAARDKLDLLGAFDIALPRYFGWQVGREALQALEMIDYHSFDVYQDEAWKRGYLYLISPASEYWDYLQTYRKWQQDDEYIDTAPPAVTMRVDPDWLREHLSAWEGIQFNVRPPTQTYLLDWKLTIEGMKVLGGLHRDGYGLVISTGRDEAVATFAAWYRGLFDAEQELYLYRWADKGLQLTWGITTADTLEGMKRL